MTSIGTAERQPVKSTATYNHLLSAVCADAGEQKKFSCGETEVLLVAVGVQAGKYVMRFDESLNKALQLKQMDSACLDLGWGCR